MTDQCPHELLRTINRRRACLQAIVAEPQEKRELVETVSTPRSTLDAIVRELEQAELVEYRDGVWRATVTGRSAAELYAECMESLESIHTAGTLLSTLDDPPSIPPAVLDGAETFESTDPVPDAVIVEFLDRIAEANHVRGVAPRALSGYTDRVFLRAIEADSTLEFVLAERVLSQLSSLDPETVADRLDHEALTVYTAPVSIEFGFWIAGVPEHLGMIVYADRGIEGILINDSADAVEWGENRYESIRQQASPVSPQRVRTNQL